jgi:hypothetical protein
MIYKMTNIETCSKESTSKLVDFVTVPMHRDATSGRSHDGVV